MYFWGRYYIFQVILIKMYSVYQFISKTSNTELHTESSVVVLWDYFAKTCKKVLPGQICNEFEII